MTFLDNAILLYTSLGMFATWIVQLHSLRYKNMSRFERMREAFVCAVLTASISVPVLEYYPDLPPSIALIVGALVGTVGLEGWRSLADGVLSLVRFRIGANSDPVKGDKDAGKPK